MVDNSEPIKKLSGQDQAVMQTSNDALLTKVYLKIKYWYTL